MHRCVLITACLLVQGCSQRSPQPAPSGTPPDWTYPHSRTAPVVDVYHGEKIADPYRWLEQADSDETKQWIGAQNQLTFSYLEALPLRQTLKERLTELWNYERFGLVRTYAGRYFYTHNDGLQDQSVLYTMDSVDGEPRVLIDPNSWSKDGTVALRDYRPSPDGKLLAYAYSGGGSDWMEWKILNIDTGEELADHLRWVKFSSVAWTKDNQGFFYSRYDEPAKGADLSQVNYYQKLYYHRVGTPQSADKLIHEQPDEKTWGFSGKVTDDGRYLIVHVWKGTGDDNLLYYQDLQNPDAPLQKLITDFHSMYRFVGNDGPVFWLHTTHEAPRGKIIAIDTRTPQPEAWQELVPQSAATLETVSFVGGRFFAQYLRDAYARVEIFSPTGEHQQTLALPGLGSIAGFSGAHDDAETFFRYTDFTTPGTIYRLSTSTLEIAEFKKPEVAFRPEEFVTRQVFYASQDGTKIPMFITHRQDLDPQGKAPTYLYGYGGFNIAITPFFSVANLVWLERGGVLAVANLRGGGEYGREWHEAGTRLRKQNVFDDFIAAAEYLIENKFTSPQHLAIGGRSNGGLLVAASLLQRPDLFAAAVPAVGVLDMLRFHRFTIGWAWTDDYGSPDNPEEFAALRAYSPLHNVQPGTAYPATLITTADHDDRVVPAHSYKFTAALQAAQQGKSPVMIRIDTRAGHGAQTPVSKRIEEVADVWAFVMHHVGVAPERTAHGTP